MTECQVVWGSGGDFGKKVNALLAEGWRPVPGTLAATFNGTQSLVVVFLERRTRPTIPRPDSHWPVTADPRPTVPESSCG